MCQDIVYTLPRYMVGKYHKQNETAHWEVYDTQEIKTFGPFATEEEADDYIKKVLGV